MTSIGLRPALLFFSLAGVNTTLQSPRGNSQPAPRDQSSPTDRRSPKSPQAACPRQKLMCPIVSEPAHLKAAPATKDVISRSRLAQIDGSRHFSGAHSSWRSAFGDDRPAALSKDAASNAVNIRTCQ
jgi:hypothetical protein